MWANDSLSFHFQLLRFCHSLPLRSCACTRVSGSPPTCSAIWSLPLLIHLPETALEMSSMISSLALPKYKGNVSVFISPDLSLPLTLFITLPFLNISPHLFLVTSFFSGILPNSWAGTPHSSATSLLCEAWSLNLYFSHSVHFSWLQQPVHTSNCQIHISSPNLFPESQNWVSPHKFLCSFSLNAS